MLMSWEFDYVFRISNVKIRSRDSVNSPVSLLQHVQDRPHTMISSIMIRTNARLVTVTADIYVPLLDGQGNAIKDTLRCISV
jgi:hypothetical protein